jgi:hypothetical protein
VELLEVIAKCDILILVLDYLVTSKVRRRLLTLLWGQNASGSVSDLAKRAQVAFASTHRELHTMKLLGFVSSTRDHGAEVFRANEASPCAGTLRDLVRTASHNMPPVDDAEAARTRGELRSLGAPLFDPPVEVSDVEVAMVRGVALAHRDPTVARVLPLSFKGAAARGVDPDRLLQVARDSGEKQSVGFFLHLTSLLSGEAYFRKWAAPFRDARNSALRSFFPESSSVAREAAERNTPGVAKQWGLRMNMSLDTFKSMYEKHAGA